MKRRIAVALAVLPLVAACGEQRQTGRASLWITRDRGAEVLLARRVPAGLTAMQALRREADVETRYGGRFVQSINGLEGSLARRRDWFYFINGYEANRSAAEYRLRAGDVEWWDFRSWQARAARPIVVGAFPEPFLHGYAGKRRPAVVRYETAALARGARAIARLIRARSVAPMARPVPAGANLFVVAGGRRRFRAELRGDGPGAPVRFVFAGDTMQLARHPRSVRFRYEVAR